MNKWSARLSVPFVRIWGGPESLPDRIYKKNPELSLKVSYKVFLLWGGRTHL